MGLFVAGGSSASELSPAEAGSHLRRGRSLLVLTQDNLYKLASPPADPHGARSPSRDPSGSSPNSPPKTGGAFLQTQGGGLGGTLPHGRAGSAKQPFKRFSFRVPQGALPDLLARRAARGGLPPMGPLSAGEGEVLGVPSSGMGRELPFASEREGDDALPNLHLHSADLFERVSRRRPSQRGGSLEKEGAGFLLRFRAFQASRRLAETAPRGGGLWVASFSFCLFSRRRCSVCDGPGGALCLPCWKAPNSASSKWRARLTIRLCARLRK